MSAKQSTAIRTLVRWRAFQEALAERECQQASARVLDAQSAVDEAQSVATAIQHRRDELLGARALDLGLLQAVDEFEQRAADDVRARTDTLDDANRVRDDAISEHLQARARSRVAETRCDRVVLQENDLEEKRLFDRMASLIAVGAMENRHD
jgi:hypothetical protein